MVKSDPNKAIQAVVKNNSSEEIQVMIKSKQSK